MAKQPKRKTRVAKVTAAVGAAVEEALSFESPDSSSIASASYDPITERLTIWFKRPGGADNQGYDYDKFPMKHHHMACWTDFLLAASKGAYFAKFIRPMYAGVPRP